MWTAILVRYLWNVYNKQTMPDKLSFSVTGEQGNEFCVHRNFATSCGQCNGTQEVFGVQRKDLSSAMQRYRNKTNVRYEQKGVALFAKSVTKQVAGSADIAGLAREAHLLKKAAASGIVPEVVDFKIYPDTQTQKARLLLKEIPGVSFDNMTSNEKRSLLADHGLDVIHDTAQALVALAQVGVHVVDINAGTFMFHKTEHGMETRVLDLELGYDDTKDEPEELQRAFNFLRGADPAMRVTPNLTPTKEVVAKMEVHRWAMTMLNMFFPYLPPSLKVAPDREAEYATYLNAILPQEESRNRSLAEAQYNAFIPGKNDDQLTLGKEAYVARFVAEKRHRTQGDAAKFFALPSLFAGKGIALDERTVDFLSRSMSPFIEERPSSFDELLHPISRT